MTSLQQSLNSIGFELDCLKDLIQVRLDQLNITRMPDGSKIDLTNMTATEKIRLAKFINQIRD